MSSNSRSGHSQEPSSVKAEFDAQLQSATRISAIDNRTFILSSRITSWLRSSNNGVTNAARVLNFIMQGGDIPKQVDRLLTHMDKADEKCWLQTFAILLQITRRNGENMGKHIVRFFHLDILDRRLGTLSILELESIVKHLDVHKSEYKAIASEIWELQWQMCTVKCFHETFKQVFTPGEMILPITKKTLIKEGGTGAIYMIEVPWECVHQSLANKLKRKPYVNSDADDNWEGEYQQLALKILPRKRLYDIETQAYDALFEERGIVECFGHWQFDNQWHLLLEWGSYDLEEFFQLHAPPTTTDGILQFWEAMASIIVALSKIHRLDTLNHGTTRRSRTYYHGWHCDLKPANILFCKEGQYKGWKIADPGFAKFVKEGNARIQDGLPVILNTGGTSEYGGPEIGDGAGDTLVTQLFDIWSVGCILSEAATWLVLGHRGVELFRLVRKSEKSQQMEMETVEVSIDDQSSVSTDKSDDEEIRGLENFHDGNGISQSVKEWHTYLRHSLRTSDTITNKILELVEKHMLLSSPKDRADAVILATLIKEHISTAKNTSVNMPTGYKAPSYFKKAIQVEQGQAAIAIQRRLIEKRSESETWRDKYKSRAFLNAMREPVGASDEDFTEYDREINTIDLGQSVERTLHRISTAPSYYPIGSHMSFSLGSPFPGPNSRGTPDGEYADYRQAREILEKVGWKSGTLELPEIPPTPSVASQSPFTRRAAGDSTWTPPVTPASEKSKHRYTKMSLIKQKINTTWSSKRKSMGSPPLGTGEPSTGGLPHRPGPTAVQDEKMSHANQGHAISEEHKDKKMNSYFEKRDIAFLVDNGSSMAKHWIWARELLAVLVAFLYGQDDDGMELYFTSSKKPVGTLNQPKEFVDLMNRNAPIPDDVGQTPVERFAISHRDASFARSSTVLTSASDESNPDDIREVLGDILTGWSRKYLKHQRKLTLIILTDGIWKTPSARSAQGKHLVANEIIHSFERWQDKGPLNEQLGTRGLSIQFVRFGEDPEAIQELNWMDDHLTATDGTPLPDIIDHTPADGNIYKMILGGLDSKYDDETTTITGDDETAEPYAESDTTTDAGTRTSDQGARDVAHSGGAFEQPMRQSHTFDVGPSSRTHG